MTKQAREAAAAKLAADIGQRLDAKMALRKSGESYRIETADMTLAEVEAVLSWLDYYVQQLDEQRAVKYGPTIAA